MECGSLLPLWFRGWNKRAGPRRLILSPMPSLKHQAAAKGHVFPRHEPESGSKPPHSMTPGDASRFFWP
jgi:hypothetical protein